MAIFSYTFSKIILKSSKKNQIIFFAILLIASFINIPLVIAQTENNPQTASSEHKASDNAIPSDSGANTSADTKPKEKNFQRIIPLSSPLYREMDRLYLLAGKSRPSLSRPWSADEAKKIMEALPKNLPDSASVSMFIIQREINFGNEKTGTKKMSSKISPEINVGGHVKTNNDREEWEYGYEVRPPIIHTPIEWWFFTTLYIDIELSLREDYNFVLSPNNYSNILFHDSKSVDWNFPFRAFGSFGGEHWNIQAGRDKVNWGAGSTSNMMISDYSDYFNIISFSTYWDRFKFSIIYIGLESWLTSAEFYYSNLSGDYTDYNEAFKCFIAHRMEFKILDNLSFSFSESSIFGNKYINISELNPFMIFHNLYTPGYSNVMLGLETDYTPFSGFNIYLQFVMDELQFPGIEDKESRPGAMGYLLGFTFVKPALNGFLTFNLEAAYTDPFLYNRWHPNTKFTNRRDIWPGKYHDYTNKPIGYKYGPDAVVMYGSIQYEKSDNYLVAIDAKCFLTGEKNDLDKVGIYEKGIYASNLWSPSGTVETNIVIGLHGKFQVTKRVTLASDIYYVHIENYQNSSGNTINDLEVTASVGFKF